MESDRVRVAIRPLKVIASVCAFLAAVLIVLSLAAPYWLEASEFREGLWDCMSCASYTRKVCQFASVGALVMTVVAFVLVLSCLLSKRESAKLALYAACLVAIFTAMICLLVTLIIFPVAFIKQEIQTYKEKFGHTEWNFSWSYGVCWGAWLFLLGAAILLLIDRTQNNTVRKEKGFYDTHL